MHNRSLLRLYALVVFLSAAMLLVLEIVAGRLLAPYIGVSLYTWTSIIGVILAGLSAGHWIGGKLADRGAGHLTTGVVLLGTAVITLAILPLLLLVGEQVQSRELGLLGASFAFVLALFFLPAAAIGVISPLLTTLALRLDERAGSVVGRMHALSAVGSILGTFITGYWLVQWMGTRSIIVSVAAILTVLALPFLVTSRAGIAATLGTLALGGGLSFITWQQNGFASPCDVESSYYCLRVVDETNDFGVVEGRSLIIDHLMHGTNSRTDPELLLTPYVHAMDTLAQDYFPGTNDIAWLFGGAGAYTLPRAVSHRDPAASITVSEIDPAVTAIARDALYLDPAGMTIQHGDVRNLLRRSPPARYDVIVADAFHDIGIPWHLVTREFDGLVLRALKPGGLYLANVIDVFPGNSLVQAMVRTLGEHFPHVGVWIEKPPEEETRLTYVISASTRPPSSATLESRTPPSRTWYNIADFVTRQAAENDAPVLTDEFAPVERLLARMLLTRQGN